MRLRFNGVAGVLSGSHSNSVTTLTLAAALTYNGGTNVPTIAAPDYMPLTIVDSTGALTEVVYVTAYTAAGTTATIVRGREGTSGVAHSSGDKAYCAATSLDLPRALEYAPMAGHRVIDEFNDASLDSAWIRVDASGGTSRADWIEAGDQLSLMLNGGDASQELHALMIPVPATMVVGDAILTRVSYSQMAGQGFPSNYTMGGLVLADGVTYGSGNQIVEFPYSGWYTSNNFTGYNSWSLNQTSSYWNGNAPMWQRIVKMASNVWRLDVSTDGIHWHLGFLTVTNSFTPTHIGVFGSSWGTNTTGIVSFDMLRMQSGVS